MTTLFDHPDYNARTVMWQKYWDLYEGYHHVLAANPSYLWTHELEEVEENKGYTADGLPKGTPLRAIRARRSRYLNLTEPVVSRWISFLFRRPAQVPDSIKKNVFGEEEYRDVNGKGMSFESFIRDQLARNYILFGKPILHVDKAAVRVNTLAEEQSLKLRPYMDILDPREVRNWQLSLEPGRTGKINWLHIQYQMIEPGGPFDKPVIRTYRKVLWLNEGKYTISLFKAPNAQANNALMPSTTSLISQPVQVGSLTPGLGGLTPSAWEKVGEDIVIPEWDEIPVSMFDGDSWIEGVSEQQLLLFNFMSAESSIANNQAFQRVIIAADMEKAEKMFFGENAVSFIKDANAKVFTIEPTNVGLLSTLADLTIDRLMKVAFNQTYRLAGNSKEAMGAESQKEAKDEFIALAQAALSELEDIINNGIRFYGKFKGINVTDKVLLDKDITTDDIEKQLLVWQTLADDYKRVPSVRKAMLKKSLEELNLPDQEKLQSDIEGFTFPAADPQQQMQARTERLQGFINGGQKAIEPSSAANTGDGLANRAVSSAA